MWLWVWVACADRVRIEDEQQLGEVVQLKDWFTSFFLRRTEDGAILVDAGFRAGAARRALEDQGVALAEVSDVFLTHGHDDHLGLLEDLPSATVWGLEAADERLEDGQIVTVGGVDVEVFAVPGHTPGSAVYRIDGVLLLGDSAIVDRDGKLVPVPEDRSDDPDELVRSMQALAERLADRADEIAWLAPSHSAPLRGFAPLAAFPEE